jgi:hypothetical protein
VLNEFHLGLSKVSFGLIIHGLAGEAKETTPGKEASGGRCRAHQAQPSEPGHQGYLLPRPVPLEVLSTNGMLSSRISSVQPSWTTAV